MNTCEQCKEEFEAKRATSRYCSSTCRSRGNRATLSKEDNNATLTATDKPLKPIILHTALYNVCALVSTQEERDMFSKVLDNYIEDY